VGFNPPRPPLEEGMRLRVTSIVYIDRLYVPGEYVQVDKALADRLVSLGVAEPVAEPKAAEPVPAEAPEASQEQAAEPQVTEPQAKPRRRKE
jgi:hypothetical protein